MILSSLNEVDDKSERSLLELVLLAESRGHKQAVEVCISQPVFLQYASVQVDLGVIRLSAGIERIGKGLFQIRPILNHRCREGLHCGNLNLSWHPGQLGKKKHALKSL